LGTYAIHKRSDRSDPPLVSVILLDWSCRQRFHALDWLTNQTVPREQYELIWVELFDRVVPKAIEDADVLITCRQKRSYHKHKGYNTGLLESRGQVITVCDSDAVFPPTFIESIVKNFRLGSSEPEQLVLMHHEWRTDAEYPDHLASLDAVSAFVWKELWPNVGACMSVRKIDAIRFGGFDEHSSYKGFICGPYDLAWRLVNAGLPEVWHNPDVALWHFAHPAPYFHPRQFSFNNLRRWFEVTYPHCEYHALTAVEGFSTGRVLPLQENPEVHKLRMSLRRIGTLFEERYATKTGPAGFSPLQRLGLRLALVREGLMRCAGILIWIIEKSLGTERFDALYKGLLRCAKFLVKVLEKILGPSKVKFLRKYANH
jgi:glycosyltransferase involved in cell wall biosynthesis